MVVANQPEPGIDGGSVGGIGDVDGVGCHRHIGGRTGRSIAQRKAQRGIASGGVGAVGTALGILVDLGRGGGSGGMGLHHVLRLPSGQAGHAQLG